MLPNNISNKDDNDGLREPLLLPLSAEIATPDETSSSNSSSTQEDDSAEAQQPQPMNRNVRLALLYAVFAFAGRSIWNQSVLATYVYLITDENPKAVGFLTAVMGMSQMMTALPTGWLVDVYRRDTMLRIAAGVGIVAMVVTLAALYHTPRSYTLLVLALAVWGVLWGIVNTALGALFADSIRNGERSYYFTLRSILINLGNVVGPIMALIMFAALGDNWTIRDCVIVMTLGQAICLPAVFLLTLFNDDDAISDSQLNLNTTDAISPQLLFPSDEENSATNAINTGDPLQDPESLRLLGFMGSDPLGQQSSNGSITTAIDFDEFHDCQSKGSDGRPFDIEYDDYDIDNNQDGSIAVYRNGKCCYTNSSPAFVSHGDSVKKVPSNFIKDCKGNHSKAMKRWQETQQWRKENDIWKIHSMPNTFFHDIKRSYPHIIHGHSKQGLPVIYEFPGKMDLKRLFRGECTVDDMIHHYIFFQEYLNNCLCASEELRKKGGRESRPHDSSDFGIMVVMDVTGAGITSLNTDVLRYLKRAGEIVGTHYPMSVKCCCVANTPFWASGVYTTVRAVLPDSVVIELVSAKDTTNKLKEYIDIEQIPAEYGGTSPHAFGEHPYEVQLCDLVDRAASGDALPENNSTDRSVSSNSNTEEAATPLIVNTNLRLVSEEEETNEDLLPQQQPTAVTSTALCCIPAHRVPAILIMMADLTSGVASGMSIRYFPIFFMENLHLSPVQLQILYIVAPLLQACLMKSGQSFSRRFGRCQVTIIHKVRQYLSIVLSTVVEVLFRSMICDLMPADTLSLLAI